MALIRADDAALSSFTLCMAALDTRVMLDLFARVPSRCSNALSSFTARYLSATALERTAGYSYPSKSGAPWLTSTRL